MAYKKYNGYRHKNYRKRYTRKAPSRWSIYGAAGSQLVKDVSMLKNMINTEYKVINSTRSTSITNSGALTLLNAAAKGSNQGDRDGRQFRVKSVEAKYFWRINASATTTVCRMMLFIDKQPSGATLSTSDLLETVSVVGQRNLDNRKRFVILRDELVGLGDNGNQICPGKFYKKLDMKTIFDDSDAGTIADISSNALYCFFISDQATNTPHVEFDARVRFIDN